MQKHIALARFYIQLAVFRLSRENTFFFYIVLSAPLSSRLLTFAKQSKRTLPQTFFLICVKTMGFYGQIRLKHVFTSKAKNMELKLPCESGDDLLKLRCLESPVRFDPAMKKGAKTHRCG